MRQLLRVQPNNSSKVIFNMRTLLQKFLLAVTLAGIFVLPTFAGDLKDLTEWRKGQDMPPSFAKSKMEPNDPCSHWVNMGYNVWFSKQVHDETGVDNRKKLPPVTNPNDPTYLMYKAAEEKAWGGASLRDTEQAVLKKCRTVMK